MKNPCHFASAILIILVSLITTTFVPDSAFADSLVTGTITSVAGEKVSGATVSAKREGSTITTSVFTDETGNYYFPPLPNGKYRIWAKHSPIKQPMPSLNCKKRPHGTITFCSR